MKLGLTGAEKRFLAIKYKKEGGLDNVSIHNKIKEVSQSIHKVTINSNRVKKENENAQANIINELYSQSRQ